MLGICNGFQILVEAGLLPGALLRNREPEVHLPRRAAARRDHQFAVHLRGCTRAQILRIPIAHGEGCYFADERTLDELEAEDRVAFRYLDNPNGSLRDIAGILNRERNVMGMMPHPERATEPLMGSTDGLAIFESMLRVAVPRMTRRPITTRADRAASAHARGVREDRLASRAASPATPNSASSA